MLKTAPVLWILAFSFLLEKQEVAARFASWDPLIEHECYSEYKEPKKGPIGPNCSSNASFPKRVWMIGTTNEDAQFGNGSIDDFPLNSPILVNRWSNEDITYPKRHQVTFGVDKMASNLYWDQYSFAGLTDSWDTNPDLPPPLLQGEVQVVFQATLRSWQMNLSNPNVPKIRAMMGCTAKWNGASHYVEVNLARSDLFRLCTNEVQIGTCCTPPACPWGAVCDPTNNLYDRRFDCGPTSPKGVYYHGQAVGQPELQLNVPANFSMDVGELFRSYKWSDYPNDWTNISLEGVYLGVEVWSQGVVVVDFANYFVWTPN